MSRVLVTGANGYIGRHVVESLLEKKVEVIATDIKVQNIPCGTKIIEKDIFSGNINIYEEFESPDICLHMAWQDGFVHNSNSHMFNLSKHYEFLYNMVNGGLKHLAVMGTMHEIGYYVGKVDENTPCNPTSFYGISKDALRRACFNLAKEKNIILQWLRAYYIYGDDLKNNSIFTKIIQANDEGKKEFPFTTGKNKYDFITVDELSNQIASVVTQQKIYGIINCCSGKPVSLSQKVEDFIKDKNLNIKLKYGAFPDRDYDSPAVWGDDTKINDILKN